MLLTLIGLHSFLILVLPGLFVGLAAMVLRLRVGNWLLSVMTFWSLSFMLMVGSLVGETILDGVRLWYKAIHGAVKNRLGSLLLFVVFCLTFLSLLLGSELGFVDFEAALEVFSKTRVILRIIFCFQKQLCELLSVDINA